MIVISKYFISFLIAIQFISQGHGERTKDKMYERITSGSGCYRRLNATHQTGCSSKRGGSTGVIHFCQSKDDLDYILNHSMAPPYIPIIPTSLFTFETVQNLIKSDVVSGLVLYSANDSLSHFTHENLCPNPTSSLQGTCDKKNAWNPFGTGLLYTEIPFPVFYIQNEDEIVKIQDCFERFNNFSYDTQADRSLCSLELKSFMFATTDTPTCRRRSQIVSNLNPVKFCDPLGDSNIWASLYPLVEGPRNDTHPRLDYKYIIIAARLDTTSMFEATAGANNPITSIVTLLSVAKYLKTILSEEDIRHVKTNVLFIFFNGETYDYIGSQRLLYDMLNGEFPTNGLEGIIPSIYPENISLYIELSQLGNSKDRLYVHHLNELPEILSFYSKLNKNPYPKFKKQSRSVPPASLHTFLNKTRSFPGLIISDHETNYNNHFYNSIYDSSSNIAFEYYPNITTDDDSIIPKDSIQQFIVNVTEIIGKSVYETITSKEYNGNTLVNISLVNELFHCYLDDPNCRVNQATQKGKLPKIPFSLYVSVDNHMSFATTLTQLALGWFTGDVTGESNINCTNRPKNYAYRYYNMSQSIFELNVTKCFRISMNTTEAVSPAFIIPDYDFSTNQYSSWTESTWSEISIRMFLKPSSAHETMTIAIGSMSLIFSFAFVYFIKSRSHILFTALLPTEAPTNC